MECEVHPMKIAFHFPLIPFFPLMKFSFSLFSRNSSGFTFTPFFFFELLHLTAVLLHHRFLISLVISLNCFQISHLTNSLASLNLFLVSKGKKNKFFDKKKKRKEKKTNIQPKVDQKNMKFQLAKIPFHFPLVLVFYFFKEIFIFSLRQEQLGFPSLSIFPLCITDFSALQSFHSIIFSFLTPPIHSHHSIVFLVSKRTQNIFLVKKK